MRSYSILAVYEEKIKDDNDRKRERSFDPCFLLSFVESGFLEFKSIKVQQNGETLCILKIHLPYGVEAYH